MGTSSSATLSRGIRLHQLFSFGFGSTVGVGWIIVAGSWIETAGPIGAVLAFATGLMFMALIALCYAEVGGLLPFSGGEVVYVFEAFGAGPAFAVGWMLLLSYVATCSFESIAIGWLVSELMPQLRGPALYEFHGATVHQLDVIVAVAGAVIFGGLNLRGGRTTGTAQDVLTIGKIVIGLVFVAAGMLGGERSNLQPLFGTASPWGATVGYFAILATIPLWFCGFNTLPQALGELRDRSAIRSLVIVMVLVLGATALFYSGVILSTAMAAPRDQLQASNLPVATAISHVVPNRWAVDLILLSGLLGIVTAWNAVYFAAARIVFAFGRTNLIPPVFGRVHSRWGSPYVAVVFVGLVTTVGALAGRAILTPILTIASLGYATAYVSVCVTLMRLRKTHPEHVRPYRVPAYPAVPIVATACGVAIVPAALWSVAVRSSGHAPMEVIILSAWLALGFLIWRLGARSRSAASRVEQLSDLRRC